MCGAKRFVAGGKQPRKKSCRHTINGASSTIRTRMCRKKQKEVFALSPMPKMKACLSCIEGAQKQRHPAGEERDVLAGAIDRSPALQFSRRKVSPSRRLTQEIFELTRASVFGIADIHDAGGLQRGSPNFGASGMRDGAATWNDAGPSSENDSGSVSVAVVIIASRKRS